MIKNIAVIGAGTMGHGIAENFALYGYSVNMYDTSMAILEQSQELIRQELEFLVAEDFIAAEKVSYTLNNIKLCTDLKEAVADADYVIEAAPEIMEFKQNLFRELDKLCKPTAILASNTSSLPLAGMMQLVSEERKQLMLVCHWYNPAHLMPIAELSYFGNMPAEIFEQVESLYISIKKQTVKVLKDVPGLVANRIQQGVAREVFSIIEQGIAEPADVDKALKFGPAFRYATTGQLEVADFGGLDIWCTVGDNLLQIMDNSGQANPLLRQKVNEGKLGIKSGEGFYSYTPEIAVEKRKRFMQKLIHQLKAADFYIE